MKIVIVPMVLSPRIRRLIRHPEKSARSSIGAFKSLAFPRVDLPGSGRHGLRLGRLLFWAPSSRGPDPLGDRGVPATTTGLRLLVIPGRGGSPLPSRSFVARALSIPLVVKTFARGSINSIVNGPTL